MKYLKTLGLLTIAAAALLAFSGIASGTITSSTGSAYTGTVEGTGINSHFTGPFNIGCKHSHIAGSVTGGSTTGALTTLTFTECNPDTVTVLKKGHFTFNKGAGGVKSSGAEVTVLTHKTIFGFPVTVHCIYVTTNTSVGTITDSHATGGHAIIHSSGIMPRLLTDSTCGGDPTIWTGTYTITKPSRVYFD